MNIQMVSRLLPIVTICMMILGCAEVHHSGGTPPGDSSSSKSKTDSDTGTASVVDSGSNTDAQLDTDTVTDSSSESQIDSVSDTSECNVDTDCGSANYCDEEKNCQLCTDDDPLHCGANCDVCGVDKPLCILGECVDACNNLAEACPDVEEEHCVGDILKSVEIESCVSSGSNAQCKYVEKDTDCAWGCELNRCKAASCDVDEDGDDIVDLVEHPGSDPLFCWRRCPLPTKWNGTSCEGTALEYTWSQANSECESLGYRLPEISAFVGSSPDFTSGVLQNCAVNGRDWSCDTCEASSPCNDLFGADVGSYWSATGVTCTLITCRHEANFATGATNYYNSSELFGVRCVK